MYALRRLLGWQIASEVATAKTSQVLSYAVAIGFFVLAVTKLSTLQLTEAELFFGVLLVLAVFLLTICVGTLVRIQAELTKKDDLR